MSAFREDCARAVGHAVLMHVSPRGGSWNERMTVGRLQHLLDAGEFTGETLMGLMVAAAEEAARRADEERRGSLGWVAFDLARLNESIDSARLARFVESLESRAV